MEKLIQEFIQYCFDHGSFLRNHKEFGELSRRLIGEAIKSDLHAQERAVSQTIVYREFLPEVLVPVYRSSTFQIASEFSPEDSPPVFVLVYRFSRKVSDKEYLYTFTGGRIK